MNRGLRKLLRGIRAGSLIFALVLPGMGEPNTDPDKPKTKQVEPGKDKTKAAAATKKAKKATSDKAAKSKQNSEYK